MTKVYVTKYALTDGIKIAETDSNISMPMIDIGRLNCPEYLLGNDWHTSPEKAIARAEEMRLKKIASLQKALLRLRALTFDGLGTS